jgi:thioredoxin 1
MSQTISVTDASFDQDIDGGAALALVDFWAPWCGPCRFMGPVLDQLAAAQGDALTVAKLNIDENQSTAERFGVRSIPTLVLLHDGQEVARHVGAMPAAQLREWLLTNTPNATLER